MIIRIRCRSIVRPASNRCWWCYTSFCGKKYEIWRKWDNQEKKNGFNCASFCGCCWPGVRSEWSLGWKNRARQPLGRFERASHSRPHEIENRHPILATINWISLSGSKYWSNRIWPTEKNLKHFFLVFDRISTSTDLRQVSILWRALNTRKLWMMQTATQRPKLLKVALISILQP